MHTVYAYMGSPIYDTCARSLQQRGAEFLFCPRAQSTPATPLAHLCLNGRLKGQGDKFAPGVTGQNIPPAGIYPGL